MGLEVQRVAEAQIDGVAGSLLGTYGEVLALLSAAFNGVSGPPGFGNASIALPLS